MKFGDWHEIICANSMKSAISGLYLRRKVRQYNGRDLRFREAAEGYMSKHAIWISLCVVVLLTRSGFATNASATTQTLTHSANPITTTIEQDRTDARRLEQTRRLNDPTYRQFADSLSMPQALAIYSEVLTKLQQLYADEDRAKIDRLYRGSVNELTAALNHAAFPAGSDALVPLIRAAAIVAPRDPQAARDAIKTLALAGNQHSGASVGLMVLECTAGACAELDSYTSYLHPVSEQQVLPLAPAISVVDAAREGPDQPVIGYVRVARFDKNMPVELDGAIAQLRAAGSQGLILDLRGVPGGSFVAAIHAAERFIGTGTIASTRGQQNGSNKVYTAHGPAPCDWPLVVLVDHNTASAAEVLAVALKDRDRAVLVGESTFGKSAVQQVIPIEAGGQLRLTVARLFGPHGRSYQDSGVAPNVIESSPERQLEMAVSEAAKLAARKAG
jgi:hypothetical protein